MAMSIAAVRLGSRQAIALFLCLCASQPAAAQRLPYADLTYAGFTAGAQLAGEGPTSSSPAPASAQVPGSAEGSSADAKATPWLQYGLLDRLEWTPQSGADSYSWDFAAFLGGETHRLWASTSGDGIFGGDVEYLEFQTLYSYVLASGWDVQAGLRYDALPSPHRLYLALGTQADVTDRLWLGAHAYLSHKGEFSARTYGQYNLNLIGALFIQPSFELDFYGSDVPELGIGRGLSFGEAGLRLRYEIAPAFAPYVGVSWERLFGRTARLSREAGEEVAGRGLVLGVRSEF